MPPDSLREAKTKTSPYALLCRQPQQVLLRVPILRHQPPAKLRRRRNVLDVPHAVARRIDVLPALLVLLRRHDLAGQGRAQHVEVDAGGQQAGAPSIEAVRKTSVARVFTIMSLCAAAAIASWVAMKRVPI